MKHLPEGLSSSIASGVTTLCWCWQLTPRTGNALGFTDHDRDVTFNGVTFEASAGFTASEIQDSVGLGIDNLDVTGAVSSEHLSEEGLASGQFDDARVEIYRVDWIAPENRVLMRSGSLGEVRRSGGAFSAEIRGLAHYLNQPTGRVFQYQCDAELGDNRCGVGISASQFTATGAVLELVTMRRLIVSGLESYSHDWFSRGLLTFNGGAADGHAGEVKSHGVIAGDVTVELWEAAPASVEVGQSFTIVAGCDKSVSTCRKKFSNVVNFRGFPHMPGNDFVTTFARSSDR
ncbi:MAG: DUF2163 domain-containing protein [Hyphomicrobiaceae bacterium]